MERGRLQGARTVLYKCGDCGTIGHGTVATIPHGWYVILSGDDDDVLVESEVLPECIVEEILHLHASFSARDVYCESCINKYWGVN